MSAISEKVRAGLYAKLNVSGVTSLATGGAYDSLAPDDAALPYVIFQRQGPRPIVYSFGAAQPTLQVEDDLWAIKAVTDEDSDPTKAPQKLAEDILAACITALGTSMTLSGQTVSAYYRFSDIPGYQEPFGDRQIFHRGFLWRVAAG